MKIKRLLGFVAIAVASVGILAACGKDAAKDQDGGSSRDHG